MSAVLQTICYLIAAVPSGDGAVRSGVSSPSGTREVVYSVGSRVKNPKYLGGFAKSANYPARVDKEIQNDPNAKPNALTLLVRPEARVPASDATGPKYEVVIINRTKKRLAFPAQDGRLYMRQEAKDASGTWKPIEHMTPSWCGNSYHTVYLGPNEFWKVRGNVYSGPFKTTLRYALARENGQYVYSDEFEGSMHEDQFKEPRPARVRDEQSDPTR